MTPQELADECYPPRRTKRAEIDQETAYRLSEYRFLKSWGYTDEHIANRLGLSLDNLQQMLRRHEQKAAA